MTSDEATAKQVKNAVQTGCADPDLFATVSDKATVTWPMNGGALTGTGIAAASGSSSTDTLLTDLNTKTFPDGTPKMKSKKWQTKCSSGYTVTISISGDSVTIKDNAPS